MSILDNICEPAEHRVNAVYGLALQIYELMLARFHHTSIFWWIDFAERSAENPGLARFHRMNLELYSSHNDWLELHEPGKTDEEWEDLKQKVLGHLVLNINLRIEQLQKQYPGMVDNTICMGLGEII